jgi:N-acyl amino acid synthase of PEP-CTERM/exosortase system
MEGLELKSVGKRNLNEFDLSYNEAEYTVKTIGSESEYYKSFRLRHQVFCEELGWVPKNIEQVEVDDYDDNAIPIGVFDLFGRLYSYLRLIMPGEPFMIEREFLSMVGPGHKIRREDDTAEISRLCIAPDLRREMVHGEYGSHSTSVVLLKGIYKWCKLSGIRYLYAVTEEKIYRLACAKGFPFKLIGEPTHMPDGVVAVAMILDWNEFEAQSALKRPRMAEWFTQYRSISFQKRSPQRAGGSQRQVFA